jgi:predicted DNA-binding protein with PD1-like motif
MLFNLPTDLLRFVFDYLNLKELGQLDRSTLSHSLRPLLTEALTGYEILSLGKVYCNQFLLEWLTSRRILVTSITLSRDSSSVAQAFFASNRSSLHSFKFFGSCNVSLDDSAFFYLRQCPHVKSISFVSCVDLTDERLQTLLGLESLSKATSASVGATQETKISATTTSTCQYEFFSSLKTFEIVSCLGLTNKTAILIAHACPNLQHLNVSGLRLVANPEVEVIIQRCPHLLTLDLSHSIIGDVSVHLILESYPNLQTLGLQHCDHVSLIAKFQALRRVSLRAIQTDVRQVQLRGTTSFRNALSCGEISLLSFLILFLS